MCNHRWRRVFEESLIGGAFSVGWECTTCGDYVANSDITPAGLGGIVLEKAARLHGPLGARSITSAGKPYKEQIIDEDGNLIIMD